MPSSRPRDRYAGYSSYRTRPTGLLRKSIDNRPSLFLLDQRLAHRSKFRTDPQLGCAQRTTKGPRRGSQRFAITRENTAPVSRTGKPRNLRRDGSRFGRTPTRRSLRTKSFHPRGTNKPSDQEKALLAILSGETFNRDSIESARLGLRCRGSFLRGAFRGFGSTPLLSEKLAPCPLSVGVPRFEEPPTKTFPFESERKRARRGYLFAGWLVSFAKS